MKDERGGFARLAEVVGFAAFDIGARGGPGSELRPIAQGVDYVGFEPDRTECDRLNAEAAGPWRSITYLPVAVGRTEDRRRLNIYRQAGCSSVLEAVQEVGRRFSRAEYYDRIGTTTVPIRSLDRIVAEDGVPAPSYVKIDVQGMEVDCFEGSRHLLSESVVAIRTEVSFYPVYQSQPLFAEVDQALRPFGFVPMRFIELHSWRRSTRTKHPFISTGAIPYSRGQMIHGDVLYLKQPEDLNGSVESERKSLIRLALVAACFDHFDHAAASFSIPEVREWIIERCGMDPVHTVRTMSSRKAGILPRSLQNLGARAARRFMR